MANLVVGTKQSVKDDNVNYLKRKNFTSKVGDEGVREMWRMGVKEGYR